MNPLDLPGPQFLLFYTAVSAVLLLLASRLTARAEPGDVPQLGFDDPYLLAYLRGGKDEALRLATISLVDRGLIEVEGGTLRTKASAARARVGRAIEKALLACFEQPAGATSVFLDDDLAAACAGYELTLVKLGLLPDPSIKDARKRRFAFVGLVLLGLAAVKILVALSRGRTNVLFLVIGAAIATYAAFKLTHPFRTARGDVLVADLRTMLASLKERSRQIQPGGASGEAALLAAVFGIAALPAAGFPYVKKLFPKARSNSGGSSCGSGCGSACGSSCGGGCGGGCGGCGG